MFLRNINYVKVVVRNYMRISKSTENIGSGINHNNNNNNNNTTRSTVVPQKLTGSKLVKKFPAFYGTRRFITAFTSAHHLSLSWASSVQSMPSTFHFLKIHLNIILPSTLVSPKWSLCLRLTHHKPLYVSPLTHTRYVPRPSDFSRFYQPNNIGWGIIIIIIIIIICLLLNVQFQTMLESSSIVMAHGDARVGWWRGNWRMPWVASTFHTTSEHGVSSITTADAHTSAASSLLKWRPPADFNGLVRFAERRNQVPARVPSQFNWSITLCQ